LALFLDRAALDAGDGQADEYEDAVQLMTLHSPRKSLLRRMRIC